MLKIKITRPIYKNAYNYIIENANKFFRIALASQTKLRYYHSIEMLELSNYSFYPAQYSATHCGLQYAQDQRVIVGNFRLHLCHLRITPRNCSNHHADDRLHRVTRSMGSTDYAHQECGESSRSAIVEFDLFLLCAVASKMWKISQEISYDNGSIRVVQRILIDSLQKITRLSISSSNLKNIKYSKIRGSISGL